jgi:hypothetical protein
MIRKLMEEREVVALIDLHGHSRKVGVPAPARCRWRHFPRPACTLLAALTVGTACLFTPRSRARCR